MAASEERDQEQVDVHEMWPSEPFDFTPWLAENLWLLGGAVGLELQEVQQEAPVGPFSLDILAKVPSTGAKVAIENQLEWTDMSHLGQLITYATGCAAHIAIWVAPEFRYEHAEALHRLNEVKGDGIRFYGVKVEVFKKENSQLQPRLRKVVYPGGWNTGITQPPGETMSSRARQFQEFFRPLIVKMLGGHTPFADGAIQNFDYRDRFFRSSFNRGVGYAASLEGRNDAWVTLHISMDDKKDTKRMFDELKKYREDIEQIFPGEKWHWRRYDAFSFSSISIRRDGSIDDSLEKREETRKWMVANLHRFKDTFDPYLKAILSA